jgi:DNA-directed RNA polymerase specialized sigma24 family protein
MSDAAWRWVEENYDRLVKLCSRYGYGDEVFHDYVLPHIIDWYNRYDGRGTMWGWIANNIRRRLGRFKKREHVRPYDDSIYYSPNNEDRLDVQYLIEGLTEDEANLIVFHVVEGFTFEELGEWLGVSWQTARNRYLRALEHARQLFKSGHARRIIERGKDT